MKKIPEKIGRSSQLERLCLWGHNETQRIQSPGKSTKILKGRGSGRDNNLSDVSVEMGWLFSQPQSTSSHFPLCLSKQNQNRSTSCFLPLSNMQKGFTSWKTKANEQQWHLAYPCGRSPRWSTDLRWLNRERIIRGVKSTGLLLAFHEKKMNYVKR